MQLSAISTPSSADQRFAQGLAAARDEITRAAGAPMDAPQHQAGLIELLSAQSSAIASVLSGASALSSNVPSGATSYPQSALEHVRDAAKELERPRVGLSFDPALVNSELTQAAQRLGAAVNLVLYPPSQNVYDGS